MSTKYRDALASAGAAADQEIGDATAQAAAKDVTISQLQTQGAAKDAAIVDLQAKLDAATHPVPVPIPEPSVIFPGDGKSFHDSAGRTFEITADKHMKVEGVVHPGTKNVRRAFKSDVGLAVHQIEGNTTDQWKYPGDPAKPADFWAQQPYTPLPTDAPLPTPVPLPVPPPSPSTDYPFEEGALGICFQSTIYPDFAECTQLVDIGVKHIGLDMTNVWGKGLDASKWPLPKDQKDVITGIENALKAGLKINQRLWSEGYTGAWDAGFGPQLIDYTVAYVEMLKAYGYGDLAFNPQNEPLGTTWPAFFAKQLAAIRSVDQKRWIMAMPMGWDWLGSLKAWTLPKDDRLAIDVHYYEAGAFMLQGDGQKDTNGKELHPAGSVPFTQALADEIAREFQGFADGAKAKGLRLHIGEIGLFGVGIANDAQRLQCAQAVCAALIKNKISGSGWDERKFHNFDKGGVIAPWTINGKIFA